MSKDPVIIAGATGTGKSELAILLAERIGGEVVSVDSMQVYCGMDIGTAKPDAAMRARVPHHLLDVAEVSEGFDAARFVGLATAAAREIRDRDRVAIFCGGTGLYFNAWLNGLGTAPAPDPVLRAELEAMPLAVLLDELARKDGATFDGIDVDNRRRVVRAVEVIRLTGRPFSQQRAVWTERAPALVGRSIGLERDREELVRRLETRVDRMFAAGLIDETRRLQELGLGGNRTASQAIGYRQVMEHLNGERGFRPTVELVKVKTRQYAKRQGTWFRGQMDLEWVRLESGMEMETVADRWAEKLG